jgi:hypothetical protein
MSTESPRDFSVLVGIQTVRHRTAEGVAGWEVLGTSTFDVQSLSLDQAADLSAAIREACKQMRDPAPAGE